MKKRKALLKLSPYLFIVILFWVVTSIFAFSNKTHAAGGVGTQGSVDTLAALAAVNSAATISDLDTALQGFFDQYNVTFSTSAVPDTSSFTSSSLTNNDFGDAKNISIQLIEEFSKYTPLWVSSSGLNHIYAVNNLVVVGANEASKNRCASYSVSGQYMVYEASCSGADQYVRAIIHHEYAHYLISHHTGSEPFFNASAWNGTNTAGFIYGNGGASCYSSPLSCASGEHPRNGFVSGYGESAIEEDQAETYSYLFATDNYQNLTSWIGSDTVLAQKVTLLKAFISSIDASIDDTYIDDMQTYALANNTQISSPFPGPGTQYILPDSGVLIWTIPTGTTTSTGIGVGGDIHRQILVVDGAVTSPCVAGHSSGVNATQDGTIMGTGNVTCLGISQGGTLSPGHSPGCLTIGTLSTVGILQEELGGTTACSGYDQLKITNTADITNSTLNVTLVNNFTPPLGNSFTIIDNQGSSPITGTFSGLPEGATFNVGGNVFKITYKGGDGNDVVLSLASVPSTPNTGFQMLTNNPLLTLFGTSFAAAGVLGIARRYSKLVTYQSK